MLGLAIVLGLLVPPADAYDKAIGWAERRLRADWLVADPYPAAEPQENWRRLVIDLEAIEAKYGSRGRTSRAIAECDINLGLYEAAIEAADEALRRDASDAAAKRLRADAFRRHEVGETLEGKVMQVQPLPNGWWAATTARFERYGAGNRMRKWAYRLHFLRPDLSVERVETPIGDGDWDEATLFLRDFDGDRKPELGLWSAFYGASMLPASICVFKVSASGVTSMGGTEANQGLQVGDLDGNGMLELRGTYFYGRSDNFSPAARPLWTDIYSLVSGRFVLANSRFASRFRSLEPELKRIASKVKFDAEVRLHQAKLRDALGDRKGALSFLALARRDAQSSLDRSLKTALNHEEKVSARRVFESEIAMVAEFEKVIGAK